MKILSLLMSLLIVISVKSDFKSRISDNFYEIKHHFNVKKQKLYEKMHNFLNKSYPKLYWPSDIKETFDDVGGLFSAKEDLKEIVDILKNPKKYKKLGAKIPRGILLSGKPGNGKTSLARAVAGHASCIFISVAGTDLNKEGYIKRIFNLAKQYAPAVLFIDEIDKIYPWFLENFLVEMDGFERIEKTVVVVAATNYPEKLEPALLRPGRFDRKINIGYPTEAERKEILSIHLKKVKIVENISIEALSRITPGFSGAELAHFVNEAAFLAAKKNSEYVEITDFEEAGDRIKLGKEKMNIHLTEHEKKIIAYHEAGHALIHMLNPHIDFSLFKVSIIPRDVSLGVTRFLPEREKYLMTKEEIETEIMISLGGHAAEEIIFNTVTNGAISDFQHSTYLLKNMVMYYGMSDLGKRTYQEGKEKNEYSDKTGYIIDQEVKKLSNYYYKKTKELLTKNRDKLKILAETLLQKQVMYASEMYTLLGMEAVSAEATTPDRPLVKTI